MLPTYRRSSVAHAIDSVVAQDFGSWELVVVDDASDDDVVDQIVRDVGDDRIRVVRRGANGGVAAAQNTGIEHARGEFVVFLHSDDELLPSKLGRQADQLSRLPASVGAVESAIEVAWPDRVERWAASLDGATDLDLLAYRRRVHISGLMVRTALAAELRFDECLRGAEDRDFCVRLLRRATVAGSPEMLSRVAKTGARLSHQNKGPVYEYLLDKYRPEIEAHPAIHADWEYRIARAYARAGDVPAARRAAKQSMRLAPGRVRRWPLWLAASSGDRVAAAAFRVQVTGAEWAQRVGRPRNRE